MRSAKSPLKDRVCPRPAGWGLISKKILEYLQKNYFRQKKLVRMKTQTKGTTEIKVQCDPSPVQGHAAYPVHEHLSWMLSTFRTHPQILTWLMRPNKIQPWHISFLAGLLAWDSLYPNFEWLSSSLHCLSIIPQASLFSLPYLKSIQQRASSHRHMCNLWNAQTLSWGLQKQRKKKKKN